MGSKLFFQRSHHSYKKQCFGDSQDPLKDSCLRQMILAVWFGRPTNLHRRPLLDSPTDIHCFFSHCKQLILLGKISASKLAHVTSLIINKIDQLEGKKILSANKRRVIIMQICHCLLLNKSDTSTYLYVTIILPVRGNDGIITVCSSL